VERLWPRKALDLLVVALALPVSGLASLAQGSSLYSLIDLVRTSVVELESKVTEPGADIILLQSPYGVMGFGAAWTYYGETKDQTNPILP